MYRDGKGFTQCAPDEVSYPPLRRSNSRLVLPATKETVTKGLAGETIGGPVHERACAEQVQVLIILPYFDLVGAYHDSIKVWCLLTNHT